MKLVRTFLQILRQVNGVQAAKHTVDIGSKAHIRGCKAVGRCYSTVTHELYAPLYNSVHFQYHAQGYSVITSELIAVLSPISDHGYLPWLR